MTRLLLSAACIPVNWTDLPSSRFVETTVACAYTSFRASRDAPDAKTTNELRQSSRTPGSLPSSTRSRHQFGSGKSVVLPVVPKRAVADRERRDGHLKPGAERGALSRRGADAGGAAGDDAPRIGVSRPPG